MEFSAYQRLCAKQGTGCMRVRPGRVGNYGMVHFEVAMIIFDLRVGKMLVHAMKSISALVYQLKHWVCVCASKTHGKVRISILIFAPMCMSLAWSLDCISQVRRLDASACVCV